MELDINNQTTRVVGIGASAGGLEALEQLFDYLPSDLNASYVVVQHLSPRYKTYMPELLSRRTKMNVQLIEDQMQLQPNHVYVIPAEHYLTLEGNTLSLHRYQDMKKANLPIDVFFESLARVQGPNGIGIILSGTGTDGTNGIRSIYTAGGTTMVQDDQTAGFDGMPKSAIGTDMVHFVGSPEEIASCLISWIHSDYLPKEEESDELIDILQLIKSRNGIDFTGYKRAGIIRRIKRRISLKSLTGLREYKELLLTDPQELLYLQKDFLIGVTRFFRDKDAFNEIYNTVIPDIVKQKIEEGQKEIRIWVAGCSKGDEAYSLAIQFQHYFDLHHPDFSFRMFATDLDANAIEYAGQGIYPAEVGLNMPEEYVERYFTKQEDVLQVSKDIRKRIVFAPHNLIKDPPFVNIDLVSCRNMLIYLQPDIQKKVLSLFHFSLNKKGFLFLGPSESVGKLNHLFTAYNRKWNIYRYHEIDSWVSNSAIELAPARERKPDQQKREKVLPMHRSPLKKTTEHLYSTLLAKYMRPCMIVDDNHQILHTFGDVRPFASLPSGEMSFNVLKFLDTQLTIPVGTGLHKVKKEGKSVGYKSIRMQQGSHTIYVNLSFEPHYVNGNLQWIVIFFEQEVLEDHTETLSQQTIPWPDGLTNQRIYDLEQELRYTQENLQATIEELETTNEELQSTNEELIAANEELQSTNEELQSVNEELISVNTEHQRKIQQLTELNNDMDNLLTSTKIGTIFLDMEMRIRRYTLAATEIVHLLEVDLGRPIGHISHRLDYSQFLDDIRTVIETTEERVAEVQSFEGSWYSVRILPYRTLENVIKGVVITFFNITELKRVNADLMNLSYVIQQSPSSYLIANSDKVIQYVNPKYLQQSGFTLDEVLGKTIEEMFSHHQDLIEIYPSIKQHLDNGVEWKAQIQNRKKDGDPYWESASFLPVRNEHLQTIHYVMVAEDITERMKAEELVRKTEMRSAVGELAAGIAHEIRNPLTALKGFVQLMRADGGNKNYIEIMLSEFDRIEQIINELLMLSKPSAINIKEEDILVLLNDVIMLLETQAIIKNIRFKTEHDKDLGKILCIGNQIKQVFINLLKNAMEAMPNGGDIHIRVKKEGNRFITVEIIDQGQGISENELTKLGQPFYTTKEKGTGLGLLVCFNIMKDINGNMEIDSEVGKGTKISLEFPI